MYHCAVPQPQVEQLTCEDTGSTLALTSARTSPRERHLPLNLPLTLILRMKPPYEITDIQFDDRAVCIHGLSPGFHVRKSFTAGTPAGCASDGGGGDLAGASPSASAVPAATGPDPTFSYPGDPECSITYGSNQAGTTTWAATVTESGELITHASDNQATSTGATPR